MVKGVSIQDILDTADWSIDSTFRQFYQLSPSKGELLCEKAVFSTQAEKIKAIPLFELACACNNLVDCVEGLCALYDALIVIKIRWKDYTSEMAGYAKKKA